MSEYWKHKLSPFDYQLCRMVESITGNPCEPKNGDDCFFIEANYGGHETEPEFILAIWDAIEGRAGARLVELKDDPERHVLFAYISFYTEDCPDAAFIPKIEQE